ncbi:hypothetical protein [Shewanella canadensis]|nr:hypothetical protein [Shewanella canadensis]
MEVFTATRRSICTFSSPQALDNNEGTTFKQTIQYQLSQKLNQKM